MRQNMRVAGAGLSVVAALMLAGCGGEEEPAASEPSEATSSPESREPSAAPSTLPGATSGGEDSSSSDSPEPTESTSSAEPSEISSGVPFGTPEPGPDDVAGNGVVVPSPSPAVEGDGRSFDGFVDQSTVDRSSAEEVAIEAMRGLSVWDTTQDTKPGDAGARVDDLISAEALERGAGGPGKWTPLWWRQATAAGAWSSADTELAPLGTDAQAPEGVELITVEVSWTWHAAQGEVVPEGDSRSCTAAVEDVGGKQTVTAFDCQDDVAQEEDMSS